MNKKLVLDILEKLIGINTSNPPGNERMAAQYLYELFESEQIQTQIQELGNNRANLIATYGDGDPEIVFCGHLDVVPVTEDWNYPPFQLTKEGGRLYGRGTSDMKSAVAAMSAVLIELARKKAKLKGRLTLVFVADEEAGNLGMMHFFKQERTPSFAVIGEPTELEVAIAHRGVLRDYVDIVDQPYHAALSNRESNAMESSAKAILSVFHLNDTLKQYQHEILPPPSIAVTMVKGYENDNIVPGHVRLMTDFRILPAMSLEECRRLEEEALADVPGCTLKKHFFLPGGEIQSDNEYVKICCQIGAQIRNCEQHPVAFDATCEQCLMTRHKIPTIICGPGSLKQAHTVDEYIEEEQIYLAEMYYLRIAETFLMGDDASV